MTEFIKACRYIACGAGLIGILFFVAGMVSYGIGSIIVGLLAYAYYSSKRSTWEAAQELADKTEEAREPGKQRLRAILAEVVDYRNEFAEKDKLSQRVIDFLEQLSPEQFVQHLEGTTRRVQL